MPAAFPEVILSFDLSVYRIDAIKKAAYKFGAICFAQIRTVSPLEAEVTLKAKTLVAELDEIAGDFCNEVLDQELREVIAEETASVRNLLLAQAFSATSLVDQIGETGDYRDDPLQIAVSDVPEKQH